jgi:hypothetical protein
MAKCEQDGQHDSSWPMNTGRLNTRGRWRGDAQTDGSSTVSFARRLHRKSIAGRAEPSRVWRLYTCQTISRHTIIRTDLRYIRITMSLRKSFSGFRKKVKDKLSKIGGKTKEIRANTGGDGLDGPASSSQSEPATVVKAKSKGDSEAGGGIGDPWPGGSLSVSQSAVEIGHAQGESDDKADGGGAGQKGLHPHSYVQVESGSSREGSVVGGKEAGQADPPRSDTEKETTPVPSVFRAGGSEGM